MAISTSSHFLFLLLAALGLLAILGPDMSVNAAPHPYTGTSDVEARGSSLDEMDALNRREPEPNMVDMPVVNVAREAKGKKDEKKKGGKKDGKDKKKDGKKGGKKDAKKGGKDAKKGTKEDAKKAAKKGAKKGAKKDGKKGKRDDPASLPTIRTFHSRQEHLLENLD